MDGMPRDERLERGCRASWRKKVNRNKGMKRIVEQANVSGRLNPAGTIMYIVHTLGHSSAGLIAYLSDGGGRIPGIAPHYAPRSLAKLPRHLFGALM